MDEILTSPKNYVGIIDDEGNVLQFYVQSEGRILAEIPVASRQGSYGVALSLPGCLELAGALSGTIKHTDDPHFKFRIW